MNAKIPIEEDHAAKMAIAPVTSSFSVASPTLEFEMFAALSNLGFYFLLIPYKIVFDQRRKLHKVAIYRLQQVPCVVFQLLTLYYGCNMLRGPHLGNLKDDPKLIFEYLITLSSIVTAMALFGTGWFRRHTIVALIDRLQGLGRDDADLPRAKKRKAFIFPTISTRVKVRACILLMSIPGVVYYCAVNKISLNRSFFDIYKQMAGYARFTFGFQRNMSVPPPAELWSPVTKALTPFYMLSDLHRYATTSMIDEILIIGSIIGFRLAKRFVDVIKRESSALVVMNRYRSLKSTFRTINDALGGCIFVLLFGVIPFYSSRLAESLEMKEAVSDLLFLLFFMYYGVALVMASEANRRAGYVKKWLCDHEENIDLSKQSLQILISDLNWNPIGLQGPGGILTITYGLLGTLMSLILTYSVIMVQLQSNLRRPEP